jgi:hypothetical protein
MECHNGRTREARIKAGRIRKPRPRESRVGENGKCGVLVCVVNDKGGVTSFHRVKSALMRCESSTESVSSYQR